MNQTRTAIIVDDDLDSTDTLSELLELKQIMIIGKGHDGNEAVELYLKLKPDIVFLDVMMPGYDGIYALKNILKINSKARVYMLTGDTTEKTHDQLRKLEASHVFYKPIDIDFVIKIINSTEIGNLENICTPFDK